MTKQKPYAQNYRKKNKVKTLEMNRSSVYSGSIHSFHIRQTENATNHNTPDMVWQPLTVSHTVQTHIAGGTRARVAQKENTIKDTQHTAQHRKYRFEEDFLLWNANIFIHIDH